MFDEKQIDVTNKPMLEQPYQQFPANSAYAFTQTQETLRHTTEYIERKDLAIFQTLEESKKQNKFLAEQVETLKEQNNMLKNLYDSTKVEAEINKKQTRHNKIFGWISFVIGTAIGIVGLLVGILI